MPRPGLVTAAARQTNAARPGGRDAAATVTAVQPAVGNIRPGCPGCQPAGLGVTVAAAAAAALASVIMIISDHHDRNR